MLIKRYLLYLFRWQLSTPILAICISLFAFLGNIWASVLANFIGGLIFFWVDRVIFLYKHPFPLWEVKNDEECYDCKKKATRCYRLVEFQEYDRKNDDNPQWRCEICSNEKFVSLIKDGVIKHV